MRLKYEFEADMSTPRVVEDAGGVFMEFRCGPDERVQVRLKSKRAAAELASLLSAVAPATTPKPPAPAPAPKPAVQPGRMETMEAVVLKALEGGQKTAYRDLQAALVAAGYAKGSIGMVLQKMKLSRQIVNVGYGTYRLAQPVTEPA